MHVATLPKLVAATALAAVALGAASVAHAGVAAPQGLGTPQGLGMSQGLGITQGAPLGGRGIIAVGVRPRSLCRAGSIIAVGFRAACRKAGGDGGA